MHGRLKPIVFFSAVAVLAVWIITQYQSVGVIRVGGPAPNFELKDQTGQVVKLSDYRGKLVFLNFWATWCAPCIEEMPEMELMTQAFRDREFQMLTISIDHDWKTVEAFLKENGLTFPALLDPGQQVARGIYRASGWPETFLIDGNGLLARHFVGRVKWSNPEVMAMVEAMIPKPRITLGLPGHDIGR